MDLNAWALYLFVAALCLGGAVLHYRRRDQGARGRHLLGVLRGLALATVLLLLFDPAFPASGEGATIALIDASLSMRLVGPDERPRWRSALEEARALGADRVLLFGSGDPVPVESLEGAEPERTESRLAPALRAVLEAGPERVVVLTDGAIEDADEVRRLGTATGTQLDIRVVGGESEANVGVVELASPRWVEAGEEATAKVGIARLGGASRDSVTVRLLRDDEELGSVRLRVPAPGRVSSGEIPFRLESGGDEPVRLDALLEAGDVEAADDRRSVYVRVQEQPPGVALVSFRGGQEPRFLLPVLERALGLPVRGWLALPRERFVRIGTGSEAGMADGATAVRAAVADAQLVVLHGASDAIPAWAASAAAEAERLLVFPAGPSDALPLELEDEKVLGEWYPVSDIPSSPIAALLAGAQPAEAPPLTALWPAAVREDLWSPLVARLGRRGEALPVLLAGTVDGRRVALALGEGYWRWAFSEGAGPDLYDRLWAGVGSWLVEGAPPAGLDPVRPAERVVARGEPVEWRVERGTADSLRVVLESVEGKGTATATVDTVVPVAGGRAVTDPVPPGHYRYQALAGGVAAESWAGPLTVEHFSAEFTRPAVALEAPGRQDTNTQRRTDPAVPLRTTPWPYVVVLLLLCTEWVLRRRWGYR